MESRERAVDELVEAPFRRVPERRSALDRAHRGDVLGALGRLPQHATERPHSWRRRLVALAAVLGPGVLVMVADNDAGGLSVYAQAGEDYGLWTAGFLVVLTPVLYVIQEMAARLGAVTGAGHARLIFERFGSRWGWFALSDLLVLNLLTIVTEFIGVSLALSYFGVARVVAVPIAALALVAATSIGGFRRWEATMFALVVAGLVIIPAAAVAAARGLSQPGPQISVAFSSGQTFLLLAVAIIGTTVAPWQLFFHQSNVVDKRITPLWLPYERVDLALGTVIFAIGALAVTGLSATALGEGSHYAPFVDVGQVAAGVAHAVGAWAGAAFAITLLAGSILGAAAVTLATSYAAGDVVGARHSLHRHWRDAPVFHGTFALTLVVAATVVLTPGVPLGVVTLGVQALAGVLLPSATVLLLLLCNDRAVLGPWVNPRWLNLVATMVVAGLLEISALLTLSLLFPSPNAPMAATVIGLVIATVVSAFVVVHLRSAEATQFDGSTWERATWSMPPLESLPPPAPSAVRALGLAVLRLYLLFAAALVVVKVVTSAIGR